MTESVVKMLLLTVSIVFLTAVIGILASGASDAKALADDGVSYLSEGVRSSSSALSISGESVPMAAAAAILRRQRENIALFTCEICGADAEGDEIGACLTKHLSGRGVLDFDETVGGLYTVTLSRG